MLAPSSCSNTCVASFSVHSVHCVSADIPNKARPNRGVLFSFHLALWPRVRSWGGRDVITFLNVARLSNLIQHNRIKNLEKESRKRSLVGKLFWHRPNLRSLLEWPSGTSGFIINADFDGCLEAVNHGAVTPGDSSYHSMSVSLLHHGVNHKSH